MTNEEIIEEMISAGVRAANADITSREVVQGQLFMRAAFTIAEARIRERCAQEARADIMKFKKRVGGRYYPGYHEDMRESVAAAIRKPKDHPNDQPR